MEIKYLSICEKLRKYIERLEEAQQKMQNLLFEKEQMIEEERQKSFRIQQQQQLLQQQLQNYSKSEGNAKSGVYRTPSKQEGENLN